jgi:cystathionine gamma-synthase
MLGFPYELSIKMIEIMGVPHRFLSAGTESDIDALEDSLVEKSRTGQKIQSVWCECPNNPMLRTSNLERVRKLADQYGFLFVVDDTIGSFANVDVMDVADIIITSLSKYLSGLADVLAGR